MPDGAPQLNIRRRPEQLFGLALELSDCGYRVFPVHGKAPLVSGFHGAAPFTKSQLDAMNWLDSSNLGWSLPPHLIGFDPDVKLTAQGRRMLGDVQMAELEGHLGALPQSFRQATPSGGWHVVMNWDEVEDVPGRLWLPDGTSCDIDIARHGKRMLVLYEPEALLNTLFEDLPISWNRYLQRQTRPWPTKVSDATEGERNNTLNRQAFILSAQHGSSPELKQQLLAEANAVGLSVLEAEATIDSGFKAGDTKHQRVLRWMQAVSEDQEILARRNCKRVLAAAMVFRDIVLHTGKTVVGMSIRQLAEEIGCQHPAASKILRLLVARGHLTAKRRTDAVQSREYTVNLPKSGRWGNTHPEGENRVFSELPLLPERLREIRQHDVFRQAEGGWLALSVADVLHHLEVHGQVPRRGLAVSMGSTRETVRKALKVLRPHVLQDSGFVQLALPVDDILEAISKQYGAAGRNEAVIAKHAQQRAERNAFLAAKEVRKQQSKVS